MDVSGRSWIFALLGRKAVDPLSSREVSMIKSDARALIRIANEIERALSSASEINDEIGCRQRRPVAESDGCREPAHEQHRGRDLGQLQCSSHRAGRGQADPPE